MLVLAFNNITANVAGNPIITTNNTVGRNNHRNRFFFSTVNITNYNVLIGRNFYDQPINDQIKKMMKLERLQQDKEMIIQQFVC